MKKRITILMMAMLMVLAVLAGCGKKAKTDAIIGDWNAVSIEANGMTVDMKQFAEQLGQDADQMKMTLTFTEDGKASLNAATETMDGTWKANGDKYEVVFEGETQEIAITDGKIIIEDNTAGAMKMVFEKQK